LSANFPTIVGLMLKLPEFVRWTSRRTSAPVALDSLDAFGSERTPVAPDPTDRVPRRAVVGGLLAFSVLPALVLGLGARTWLSQDAPAVSLTIDSDPAGAEVHVAGIRKGVTPLSLSVEPGPQAIEVVLGERRRSLDTTAEAGATVVHHVTFVEAAGPPAVAVRTSGTDTTRRKPPEKRPAGPVAGWISVTSPVALQVIEKGQVIGTTAASRIMLAAGRHDLLLVNEDLGFSARRAVQVQPGRSASLRINVPTAPLSLNAVPWAEAWIDGRKVGETPIGNHAVPIGTHEIVFRHPELGERRATVVVSLARPARVSVDMRRPRP